MHPSALMILELQDGGVSWEVGAMVWIRPFSINNGSILHAQYGG